LPVFSSLAQAPSFKSEGTEQRNFFDNPKNCQSLKISWLSNGDSTAPSARGTTPFCDPTGPEIGSESVTYAKPGGVEKTFLVNEESCDGLFDFSSKVGFGMMSNRALLLEHLEKQSIAFLVANNDDLDGFSLPTGGLTSGATDIWKVGVAADEKSLIHINHFAQDQRMINPVTVVGSKFRYQEDLFLATQGGGVADARRLLLNPYAPFVRDNFYFDTLAASDEMYLVDRASLGYVNYTYERNMEIMDTGMMALNTPYGFRYADPELRVWDPVSMSLRPYYWDVSMVRKCISNEYRNFSVAVTITGSGGFLKAPLGTGNRPVIVNIKYANA